MKRKQFVATLVLVSTLFTCVPQVTYAKATVKLNYKSLTLTEGQSKQLKLRNVKKKKLVWKTSNKKVVRVTSKGKVKAVKRGTAKVTVSYKSKKYTCKIRVVKRRVTPTAKISVKPTKTPKPTLTKKPTRTPKPTVTVKPTATVTATPKPTAVLDPTATPMVTVTIDPTVTVTIDPTATVTPEPTATATPEPTATATPEPTATATPEPTVTATLEPTATATPEPTATATPEPTATATPGPTATATPEPTVTVTLEPTATVTPEPTATATPEPTVTAIPEPTVTSTPTPEPTLTPVITRLELNILSGGHNLVKNCGFEEEKTDWNFTGEAEVASHHPYRGSKFATLNHGSISQEITIPENGTYNFSAYISTGMSDTKMTVYDASTNETLGELVNPLENVYTKRSIESVYCVKGQRVRLEFSSERTGWYEVDQVRIALSSYEETEADYGGNNGDSMTITTQGNRIILSGKESAAGTTHAKVSAKGKKNMQYRVRAIYSTTKGMQGISAQTGIEASGNIVKLEDPVQTEVSTGKAEVSQSFFVGDSEDDIVIDFAVTSTLGYQEGEIVIEDIAIEEDPQVVEYPGSRVNLWIPKKYVEEATSNHARILFERLQKNTEQHYENLCELTGVDELYQGEPLNITVGSDELTVSVGAWSGTRELNIIRVSKYNLEDMLKTILADSYVRYFYQTPLAEDWAMSDINYISYFTTLHEVSHCFDYIPNNWNFRGELMANFKACYTMDMMSEEKYANERNATHILWDGKCYQDLEEVKTELANKGNGCLWMVKGAEAWKAARDKQAFWDNKEIDEKCSNWYGSFNCDNGINSCMLDVKEVVGWDSYKAAFRKLNYQKTEAVPYLSSEDQYKALMTEVQNAYHPGGSEVADSFIKNCDTTLSGEEMQQFIYEYIRYMRIQGR